MKRTIVFDDKAYDKLCRILTDFEDGGSEEEMYEYLVELQNAITESEDAE